MTFAPGDEKLPEFSIAVIVGSGHSALAGAALGLLTCFLLTATVGCSRSASVSGDGSRGLRSAFVPTAGSENPGSESEARAGMVFIRRGRPLVLAVAPAEQEITRGRIDITIDGVAGSSAMLYRLAAEPISEVDRPDHRLTGNEPAELTGLARASRWLATSPESVRWRAIPAAGEARATEIGAVARGSASRPAGGGDVQEFGASTWIAVVHLPIDQPPSGIRSVTHGPRALRVVTLDDQPARSLSLPRDQPLSVWGEAAVREALGDPFQRWRARLALGRLGGLGGDAGDEFSDRVVELLARQFEAPFVAALARVSAIDAGLAERLAGVIAGWVDFGGGVVLPVWWSGPSEAALDAGGRADSLASLLQAIVPGPGGLTDMQVKERVTEFLNNAPRLAAWVSDDAMPLNVAGLGAAKALDAGRSTDSREMSGAYAAVTVGVVNLGTDGPVRAVVDAVEQGDPDSGRPGGSVLTPARQCRFISIKTETPGTTSRINRLRPTGVTIGEVVATVGKTRLRRGVLERLLPAAPPGVVLGPVLPDWTHDQWLRACTSAEPSAGLTLPDAGLPTVAGLLFRIDGGAAREDSIDEASAAGQQRPAAQTPSRWVVYLEVSEPVTDGDSSERQPRACGIELHFGPRAESLGVASISRDQSGNSVIRWRFPETHRGGPEATRAVTPPPMLAPQTTTQSGSARAWRAWIPVPPRCVGVAGVLQIGLVLELDLSRGGGRAAWPRPMMPWEAEPARLSVDLSTWSGLAP